MNEGLKEIKIDVSRESADSRSVNIYVYDGARKVGRYQVRTNADGRRDVYYSDIEGATFNKTRKVSKPADPDPELDPVISSIAADLASRGLTAPSLMKQGFSI